MMDWKLVVKDVGELSNWMEPIGWSQEGAKTDPQVALLISDGKESDKPLSPADAKDAQEALQQLDGKEVTFNVTALVKHVDLIVAEVDLPEDVPYAVTLPHLKLWRSEKNLPSLVNDLLRGDPSSCADSLCFDPAIALRGIITGEKKEDPMNFVGKFLKVENQPLLNKQAEPKGCATFLQEEQAEQWKASLAKSIKEDPAGPEGCKLKANVQGEGRPGHIYLRWGAAFANMTAKEIVKILEGRLAELIEDS